MLGLIRCDMWYHWNFKRVGDWKPVSGGGDCFPHLAVNTLVLEARHLRRVHNVMGKDALEVKRWGGQLGLQTFRIMNIRNALYLVMYAHTGDMTKRGLNQSLIYVSGCDTGTNKYRYALIRVLIIHCNFTFLLELKLQLSTTSASPVENPCFVYGTRPFPTLWGTSMYAENLRTLNCNPNMGFCAKTTAELSPVGWM